MHSFPNIHKTYKYPNFFKAEVVAKVSIESNDCELMKMFYPNNYQNYCYGLNFIPEMIPVNDVGKSKLALSFAYNDSLFVYDIKSNKKKTYFFGSKLQTPVFKHLDFNEIGELNQTVFYDLYSENPYYGFSEYFPLSKYYTRLLLKKSDTDDAIIQFVCLFDNDLNYIGESDGSWSSRILCDSKKGIQSISIDLKKHKFIVFEVSWR